MLVTLPLGLDQTYKLWSQNSERFVPVLRVPALHQGRHQVYFWGISPHMATLDPILIP